jgi:hypothetical protein
MSAALEATLDGDKATHFKTVHIPVDYAVINSHRDGGNQPAYAPRRHLTPS